ncbi:DUF5947 family protein [Nonomuraea sp. NEAU-A123]|uniref:DUF5947 family protein n=1 Tax=Nonomuraea sp. NEAU-A123 TaxID=2839649 RepID=UPI001BE4BEF7|nr:DUF5947 family protein [Nonomuraea sp. NEAU-A123]MBT2226572.1 hypothetical protein [Nonomuraea sp. NEAU-A123]
MAPRGLRGLINRAADRPRDDTDRPAGRSPADQDADQCRCELCAAPIPAEHRHLLEPAAREPRCACRPCALLFDHPPAEGDHYRLVPDRRWYLPDFALDDATWESLEIPVQMAFACRDSSDGRTVIRYPGPAGAVEAATAPAAWAEVEAANPVLRHLAPDVEALLVNRTGGARDHWLVPIDDCFALVAVLRSRWKGLAGGQDVWNGVGAFFTELRGRAKPVPADLSKGVPR